MKTNKIKPIKRASEDPVKEALSHPSGPGFEEMINRQEEKKPDKKSKQMPGNLDIPVI
jgi:hypothetical protein